MGKWTTIQQRLETDNVYLNDTCKHMFRNNTCKRVDDQNLFVDLPLPTLHTIHIQIKFFDVLTKGFSYMVKYKVVCYILSRLTRCIYDYKPH